MSQAQQSTTVPVVLLASGQGSLARTVISAALDPSYPARIVGLVSDRACPAVAAAHEAGIPSTIVEPAEYPDRSEWDQAITDAVSNLGPDWVVSAGFMRILGSSFLAQFGGRILNTHPALLPSFPGGHAVRDALNYGVSVTGCTVHFVDSGVDTGPIISQCAVEVRPGDSEALLHERIKVCERTMLVEALADAVNGRLTIQGRKVIRS